MQLSAATRKLEWNRELDSFGDVTKANEPSREPTTWNVDARGAVKEERLPDGAVSRYDYDDSGAQSNFTDPTSEATRTSVDDLGRPLKRFYADDTSESFTYDGSRLSSMIDRAGRMQSYEYDAISGQLLRIVNNTDVTDTLTYDGAGRLKSWKTPDTLIEWEQFDFEGRPKRTKQTRYFADRDPEVFVQEHVYNVHGERTRFSMPVREGGAPLSASWIQWITQEYDAMGNVVVMNRRDANGANEKPLMTAQHRAAGRPDVRTLFTPNNKRITREYAYDSETSQLRGVTVKVGDTVVAGTAVSYDGLQVESAQQLGIASNELETRSDVRVGSGQRARSPQPRRLPYVAGTHCCCRG